MVKILTCSSIMHSAENAETVDLLVTFQIKNNHIDENNTRKSTLTQVTYSLGFFLNLE